MRRVIFILILASSLLAVENYSKQNDLPPEFGRNHSRDIWGIVTKEKVAMWLYELTQEYLDGCKVQPDTIWAHDPPTFQGFIEFLDDRVGK